MSGNEQGSTARSLPTNATTKCSSPGLASINPARPTRPRTGVEGLRISEKVPSSLPTCPIPEIKRLGKTLKQWREAFLV